MDFKIGDKVVYPNHGVGIIEQINFGLMNGRTEKYYMLKIVSSGLKVMVPSTNAISVGLRPYPCLWDCSGPSAISRSRCGPVGW